MDSEKKTTSNVKSKKNRRKNEKKKQKEKKETDETLDEVRRQMNKLADEECSCSGSASSTDSEDLVNAINYNTITSLAALKDIIQGDGNDTPETDSFFQHYFMNHCNNLSSRNSSSNAPFPFAERRRLSQCREEDEDDDKKDVDPPPSAVSSESCSEVASQGSLDALARERITGDAGETDAAAPDAVLSSDRTMSPMGQGPPKQTVMGARHKFLVTKAESPLPMERALRSHIHNAHTVHFGTKGAEEQRPNVRDIFARQNLHRDKNYFDSSLIEIRSTVDGVSTDLEDIWVKRTDDKKLLPSNQELSKTDATKDVKEVLPKEAKVEPERARSGTWGSSQTARKETDLAKNPQTPQDKNIRRSSDDRRQKREQRLDAAITRSTQSVGERKRRASADEGQPHLMYQQTIHGTTGVSRRPALFDMFKSWQRSDAKKQTSIMQQVKAAVQSMTKSNIPTKDTSVKPESSKPADSNPPAAPAAAAKAKDGSAHPHPGSDKRYYHTVTASPTRRPSAMAKVMDIFRGRASIPGQSTPSDGADRRKARSVAQQHHHAGKPY